MSWRDETFADWTLIINDDAKSYRLHRCYLARGPRRSTVLLENFLQQSADAACSVTRLTIPDTCVQHFDALLDFVYDGKLTLQLESALPLYFLAHLLGVQALQTKIRVYVRQAYVASGETDGGNRKSKPSPNSEYQGALAFDFFKQTAALREEHGDASFAALSQALGTITKEELLEMPVVRFLSVLESGSRHWAAQHVCNVVSQFLRHCSEELTCDLFEQCLVLLPTIDENDACFLYRMALDVCSEYGIHQCYESVENHFGVLPVAELLALPFDTLCSLLSSDNLGVTSEALVFNFILEYGRQHGIYRDSGVSPTEEAEAHVATLWSHCRFAWVLADQLALAASLALVPGDAVLTGSLAQLLWRRLGVQARRSYDRFVATQPEGVQARLKPRLRFAAKGTFTWIIPNFTHSPSSKMSSEVFSAAGRSWSAVLYPRSSDYLGVKIAAHTSDSDDLAPSWSAVVKCHVTLSSTVQSLHKEMTCHFSSRRRELGWKNFIELSVLNNPKLGFLDRGALQLQISILPCLEAATDICVDSPSHH